MRKMAFCLFALMAWSTWCFAMGRKPKEPENKTQPLPSTPAVQSETNVNPSAGNPNIPDQFPSRPQTPNPLTPAVTDTGTAGESTPGKVVSPEIIRGTDTNQLK